jgi:hypothetical protein
VRWSGFRRARDADLVVREMKERFPMLRLSFETVGERKRNLGQAVDRTSTGS